jgi:hypothetical protein
MLTILLVILLILLLGGGGGYYVHGRMARLAWAAFSPWCLSSCLFSGLSAHCWAGQPTFEKSFVDADRS